MSAQPDIRVTGKQIPFSEIPVIDISALVDGSDPQRVAKEIGKAAEEVGFFYVKNHGVPKSAVEGMYRAAEEFFNLPIEAKERLHVANTGPTLRGYIPINAENVDPKHTRDLKEVFEFGEHEEKVSPFFGPNPMPSELPDFKETAESYHSTMLNLARKLTNALALSLDLPADYFDSMLRKPITYQRLLHYPPQEGRASQEEMGIGAHTDYGFLTILSQDNVGGLQVQNRAGEWISAPPIEDTFVINSGDLIRFFTNDRYPSTMHRVVNNTGRERYSIPFFLDLDFDAVVEPVPTCVSADNPAKYSPFKCGEHKYQRFVDSYVHLQDTATD